MRELPPGGHRHTELAVFAAKLRENPGDWQPYPRAEGASKNPTSLRTLAYAINNGRLAAFPSRPDTDGHFAAAVRNHVLYICYVAPETEPAEPETEAAVAS